MFKCEILCMCISWCADYIYIYTECPRRNVPDFGRVFLMFKYTDITQNTYIQSWTVTEIMARERGFLWFQILQPAQLIRHVTMRTSLTVECSVHYIYVYIVIEKKNNSNIWTGTFPRFLSYICVLLWLKCPKYSAVSDFRFPPMCIRGLHSS